ncbi:MAG: PAS domain S-box protein, partial [Chloroflexota bacterium]
DITERRREQERYKAIIQNAPDGFWLNDADGKLLDVNDAYCKMAGYTREELLEKNIKDIEAVESPYEIMQHIKNIRKNGRDIFETQHKCKDGNIKDVEVNASYIDLGEVHNLVFVRDIKERKQVQEALYESEEKYRGLVKNVRLGVFRSTPGPTGRFLEVNPAMQEITGYSREELLSMDVCNLFLNPEQRGSVSEEMSRATGTVTKELKFKKKDGSKIVVSDIKAPVKDSDEEVLYFDGTLEDITERKQAEEELRESEERYRALFESTFDIVQSVAPDGSFIFVNPAWFKTLGYTKDELPGITLFDIIHPKSLKHFHEMFRRIISGETVNNIQATFVAKDGREILIEGNAIPRITNGKVIASQGFFRDITEKKIMEEQLIVTDKLASIGELASGIAHELNNPLTGVIGFSELLLEKDVPNEIREDIAIIHHEAMRASEVVKNLLTFAHKHTPSKQPVNINSIIATVLSLRAYEQKVCNIDVITRFAPDLPDVIADGFQLQQVFLNIIVNAGYAMEEAHDRGVIKIKTEWTKDTVRVIFIDDGPGISKENLTHIFDPFFTTKEVGKGTGLGLSICHGIITEHKGKISVLSEPGKGATFVVELPICKLDEEGGKG